MVAVVRITPSDGLRETAEYKKVKSIIDRMCFYDDWSNGNINYEYFAITPTYVVPINHMFDDGTVATEAIRPVTLPRSKERMATYLCRLLLEVPNTPLHVVRVHYEHRVLGPSKVDFEWYGDAETPIDQPYRYDELLLAPTVELFGPSHRPADSNKYVKKNYLLTENLYQDELSLWQYLQESSAVCDDAERERRKNIPIYNEPKPTRASVFAAHYGQTKVVNELAAAI